MNCWLSTDTVAAVDWRLVSAKIAQWIKLLSQWSYHKVFKDHDQLNEGDDCWDGVKSLHIVSVENALIFRDFKILYLDFTILLRRVLWKIVPLFSGTLCTCFPLYALHSLGFISCFVDHNLYLTIQISAVTLTVESNTNRHEHSNNERPNCSIRKCGHK